MDAIEIERMARLEHKHWWYRGLRNMIGRALRLPRLRPAANPKILDAGCGTGENLRFLRELLSPKYAGGFDISPDAVRLTRQRVGGDADIYLGDLRDPEVHVESLDLVISCDVVSLAGIAESRAGMVRLVQRLERGGLFIINIAAYRWLFSSHDIITCTKDRANAAQIARLFAELGLRIELLTYRVFALFPAIVAARLPSMLRRPELARAHSDLWAAPRWINSTLASTLYAENWLVSRGARLPWGSSVFAIGRKQ